MLLVLIINSQTAFSESEEEKTLGDKILDKYWNIPTHLQNYPTIEVNYGLAQPGLLNTKYSGKLALAYSLDLKYAFTRYYGFRDIPGRFYYASEFAFMSDVSSHLKPRLILAEGLTTDNWRFGIGYRNGYGYEFSNESKLILYHASSFVWSTVDFEGKNSELWQNPTLKDFDETTRFGQSFEGGAIYSLSDLVHLSAGVENQLIYPRHKFVEWLAPFVGELIIQRTIDYFGDDLLKSNKAFYPILNMAVKYAVSYILFNLKRNNMYWPFQSGSPMIYSNFKIGANLTF